MERVSKGQYTEAIARFVALARQPTVAQVLLSAYNGSDLQLDLAGMGNLDRSRGRYETGHEFHSLIADGSSVFDELWDSWFALHVTERGNCDGRLSLWLNPYDEKNNRTKPCPRCAGQRRICRCGR